MRGLMEAGHTVDLITLGRAEDDVYEPPDGVHHTRLSLTGHSRHVWDRLSRNLRMVLGLRVLIRRARYDHVLAMQTAANVVAVLAMLGLSRPVVSERVDPREHQLPLAWRIMRKLTYRRVRALVIQTENLRPWGERIVGPRIKVWVVPNPICIDVPDAAPIDRPADVQTLIAVGRLARQKGFDLLLPAFALTRKEFPNWRLVIYGDGPEREALASLAADLDVLGAVQFPGFISPIRPALTAADAFVLPSRYEGFPNALLEAMSVGLPCIASDCRSGPRDIITTGIDGILVPPEDIDALGRALCLIMRDHALRDRLGSIAATSVQRFEAPRVLALWLRVLAANAPVEAYRARGQPT